MGFKMFYNEGNAFSTLWKPLGYTLFGWKSTYSTGSLYVANVWIVGNFNFRHSL